MDWCIDGLSTATPPPSSLPPPLATTDFTDSNTFLPQKDIVNADCLCQISSVGNCLARICRGVEGLVGEVKSVSWGGARTKGEVHKR